MTARGAEAWARHARLSAAEREKRRHNTHTRRRGPWLAAHASAHCPPCGKSAVGARARRPKRSSFLRAVRPRGRGAADMLPHPAAAENAELPGAATGAPSPGDSPAPGARPGSGWWRLSGLSEASHQRAAGLIRAPASCRCVACSERGGEGAIDWGSRGAAGRHLRARSSLSSLQVQAIALMQRSIRGARVEPGVWAIVWGRSCR